MTFFPTTLKLNSYGRLGSSPGRVHSHIQRLSPRLLHVIPPSSGLSYPVKNNGIKMPKKTILKKTTHYKN